MLTVWLKFIFCAAVILYAGFKATTYGDKLAEKTGIGKAWVGLVLMATLTSLPELANGLSAVIIVNEPTLAVGNIFGACLFNLLTIGLIDIIQFFRRKPSIFAVIREANVLSAIVASFLLLLAALGVAYSAKGMSFPIAGVGIYTILIFLIYLLTQKLVYEYEKKRKEKPADGIKESLRELVWRFIFFGMIVVAAGTWLPAIGQEIVAKTPFGTSFVAMFFLGLATTLPEIVVSVTAIFLGAPQMALGNLIGSNMFNISLLFVDDVFYRGGPLLEFVSSKLDFAALFAALGMGFLLIGMLTRKRWVVILILANFIIAFLTLFYLNVTII